MRGTWLAGAVLGLALGLHGVAAADDHDPWFVGVAASDQSREYVDALTDMQTFPQGHWSAWVVDIMPDDSHGYVALASNVDIDCDGARFRSEDAKYVDRQGKVLRIEAKGSKAWSAASDAAGTAQILAFVCGGGDNGKDPAFHRASGPDEALATAIFSDWNAAPSSTWTGGWSFARWGMTRPEVEAAGRGLIHLQPDDGIEYVDGEVNYGPYKLSINLTFDGETDRARLTGVTFFSQTPTGGCPPLRAYFEKAGTFGTQETSDKRYTTWTDTKDGNSVSLEDMGTDTCNVELTPLTPPDPDGR